VKVGIVVPFSWAYIGGVVEHAECQAQALAELGLETRLIMGDDRPGGLTGLLHPHAPRHDARPPSLIAVGGSVTVLANESRPNIVLSPAAALRLRRVLARERFDLLHLHEPMTPVLCVQALASARCPVVGTWHATGDLRWTHVGMPLWGMLMDRVDYRIAVSELARSSAMRYLPGEYEVIPNGITIPPRAELGARDNSVVFIGRNDPRKGLEVLLRAWPEVRDRTGARLRVVGTAPAAVQLAMSRLRLERDGVDLLGVVVGEPLTRELLRAKLLVAPSLGGESFGMVLARAFGCATPVVASDIPGYRRVLTPEIGVSVPPGDGEALTGALIGLLEDEPRRQRLGAAARGMALERYAWDRLARRLLAIYERVLASA
jgi:phosphatidylinositol alpha-mannosyltransferase